MHLSVLLDMSADAMGDRVAVTDSSGATTFAQLRDGARSLARAWSEATPPERVVFLGLNSRAVPYTLFASALAGAAFTPLNYRLTDPELRRIAERAAPAIAVVDDDIVDRLSGVDGLTIVPTSELLSIAERGDGGEFDAVPDPDAIGVLLFTSGTTGEPKAAVLRHSHLASYVFTTLEFGGADPDEAGLVSVPPYHIAGISAIVSSSFTGRRIAYLANFTPAGWLDAIAEQSVTHAMVVPTMLGRVLDELDNRIAAGRGGIPTLRHLSYGGGRMPVDVIERAVATLPDVDFVNAYGLTETSSTIAVLTPDDHREALASSDPAVRARLGSVGRPSPAIEVSIRDESGEPVPAGQQGEIWVRGDQVSGEYLGRESRATDGWFPTNDSGLLDEAGYLYVHGRLDDVIVRGGENISPGEIEDVLRTHPGVDDVAVFGVPSTEWGETIAAVIVPGTPRPDAAELQAFVREQLRSTKSPEFVEFRTELPYNETGKLLRRVLRSELTEQATTATSA
ncbi:class I adenylate-forming enzyme family protein [Desertimonas flava]|jgi:acyl-CoA synthetase (AMP-forming)/AMP-acid ligase II|uniref:class I adenylate-forming enzyme family protein n=1 Tax=Desertimonas flava TaxID=2064846 RepID=UPI000E354F93|nr:AMP-binding protein [Desertimonas flava]